MSFSDQKSGAQLLARTLFGTADFKGRSRRKEVLYWSIGATLIGCVVVALAAILLPSVATLPSAILVGIVLVVPSYALFVRRLHDQDRTGWIALLLLVPIALDLVDLVVSGRSLNTLLESEARPTGLSKWLSNAVGLGVLILAFLPGTRGANRFGADPRP